jgi:hypothetical protein
MSYGKYCRIIDIVAVSFFTRAAKPNAKRVPGMDFCNGDGTAVTEGNGTSHDGRFEERELAQ